MDKSIKLAISGKGGVGKTTIAAFLCKAFNDRGYTVLAVDADPAASLSTALGFSRDAHITPIVEMKELIEERTGAKPGTTGSFFKLNPKVDDLPEKLWNEKNGIKLLIMGTVKQGGGGCICPESALLKTLMQHIFLYRKEAVIMDMEAGIEHLGRATAQAVERMIIVVEPGMRSIETAFKIKQLAEDIKLTKVSLIMNKIQNEENKAFVEDNAKSIEIIGCFPFDNNIIKADMNQIPPWELSPALLHIAEKIIDSLLSS